MMSEVVKYHHFHFKMLAKFLSPKGVCAMGGPIKNSTILNAQFDHTPYSLALFYKIKHLKEITVWQSSWDLIVL